VKLARKAVRGLGSEIAELRTERGPATKALSFACSIEEHADLKDLANAAGQTERDLVRLAVARLIRDVLAMSDDGKPAGGPPAPTAIAPADAAVTRGRPGEPTRRLP
jgi:hypothetical protein